MFTYFMCCFLRIRRTPRSTRTDTLFPYPTLFRSVLGLDSAEFTSGINRANRATGQFAKQGKTFETATRGMSTALRGHTAALGRSEEHTSELQSLMRNSYAIFCLTKKNRHKL